MPPHTLLKTSSGKIRRAACRELYSSGRLAGSTRRSAWRQILATAASTTAAWIRRAWRTIPSLSYTAWAWLLAGGLVSLAWCGVMLLPSLGSRRRWTRRMCATFFRLAGIPIEVEGRGHLAEARATGDGAVGNGLVIAANHASFLDSMILIAALDAPLAFVAKRAFERNAVTRPLMKRLGVSFVDPESLDPREGLETWTRRVERGETLVVFVEGTFVRAPGLRSFKLGAFEVAVRARSPVVPLTIDGSRELLRDEQWWMRRTSIDVRVSPAVRPVGEGFAAAIELRDEVRRAMVATTREVDLEADVAPSGVDWDSSADSPAMCAIAEGARR